MPAPSQDPSVAQLAAPASVHWASGSCPAGTLVQVPALAASAHVWQVPVQLVAQQTPCWQKPEAQSPAAVQVAPSAAPPQPAPVQQIDPLQVYPEAQSVLLAQVVLQSPPVPQTYGAQLCGVPATQSPTPSQRPPGVSLPLLQLSVPHVVPEA